MVKIKLLIEGGDMKPGPTVAQQLGPMGVNMGQVISSVNDVTKEFKGMKVPVELDVDEKTKKFTIHTSSPPTSELLKKELGIEKGSDKHEEIKVGNASIEDIIKVAKIKQGNMLERDLNAAVKSVLGTCASIGILVESKSPIELTNEVNKGKFDKEINEGKTETDSEKRSNLNTYFSEIKSAQDVKIAESKKAEEEAAATKKVEAKATTAPTAKSEEKKEEKK